MKRQTESRVSPALAAATCALLGNAVPSIADAQDEARWEFDSALLYYGEDDDRVEDLSLNVLARRSFVDDRFLTLGLSVDTLTGATPSGAIRQSVPQTFTRPSGNDTYTIAAGDLPVDDTFRDTRVALNASWQQPWGRSQLFSLGASASTEYDYLHLGINGRLAKDFNQRNTTVSAGLALSQDTFDPVGGAPEALSLMRDVGDLGNRAASQDKEVVDLVVGVSQVLSRNLIVQMNYSLSQSSGYLNDPYKFLSVVDGTSGDTVFNTPSPGVDGPSHLYRFENRPDERTKHSLFGGAKFNIGGQVLDASYRYMTDDWDIDSHTLDIRYRWPLGNGYLEPHVRYYTQAEADFYATSIVDGDPLPDYASADYRLGNFDAVTLGIKYGWRSRGGQHFSVRVESYQQEGSIPAGLLIGDQAGLVQYPDLNALIVQFSYHFER